MKIIASIGILLLTACGPFMKPTVRVESPDGDYVVAAIPNDSKSDPTKYRCIRLILENRNGNVLSALQTSVSDGQKWAVGWMETENVIVLQSGDIGTQAYTIESNELNHIEITPAIEIRAAELKKAKYGK